MVKYHFNWIIALTVLQILLFLSRCNQHYDAEILVMGHRFLLCPYIRRGSNTPQNILTNRWDPSETKKKMRDKHGLKYQPVSFHNSQYETVTAHTVAIFCK